MSEQQDTMSDGQKVLSLLQYFEKTLKDLNLNVNEMTREMLANIAAKDDSFVMVASTDHTKTISDLQHIVTNIARCESVVSLAISTIGGRSTTTNTEPKAKVEKQTTAESSAPVVEKEDQTPSEPQLKKSFHKILLQKVSKQIAFLGTGSFDTTTSTLNKYAESLVNFLPRDVASWPDGWYNVNNPDYIELLLTLDRFPEERSELTRKAFGNQRFHALFYKNDKTIVPEEAVVFRFSDGDRWLKEEFFSSTVLMKLRFALITAFATEELQHKLAWQNNPDNPANKMQ